MLSSFFKLVIFCVVLFATQSVLYAQALEPKFRDVQKVPQAKKEFTYGPYKCVYPADWRLRKLITGTGVRVEGPLSYLYGVKAVKFGVSVTEQPSGGMNLEVYMKAVQTAVENNFDKLREKINKEHLKKEQEALDIKVALDAIGKFSMEKLQRNGKECYYTVAKSSISVNGVADVVVSKSLWSIKDGKIYSLGGAYLESDKARFEKFTDWMIAEATLVK